MSNESIGELTLTRIDSTPDRQFWKVEERLWVDALRLGTVVQSAFSMSVSVLRHRRTEFTGEIKAAEVEIDRSEVQIELECLRILALYGPVASDLRRVLTVLQVNRALSGSATWQFGLRERPPSWPLYRRPWRFPTRSRRWRKTHCPQSASRSMHSRCPTPSRRGS